MRTMAINIPGLVAVIVFYIFIIVTGIIGSRKTMRSTNSNEIFVANRSIGVVLAYFTLTGIYAYATFSINSVSRYETFSCIL